MIKLTKAQRACLLAARDLGGPWRYRADKPNQFGVTIFSYPWSAPRARMIRKLAAAGLLATAATGPIHGYITDAGRKALES